MSDIFLQTIFPDGQCSVFYFHLVPQYTYKRLNSMILLSIVTLWLNLRLSSSLSLCSHLLKEQLKPQQLRRWSGTFFCARSCGGSRRPKSLNRSCHYCRGLWQHIGPHSLNNWLLGEELYFISKWNLPDVNFRSQWNLTAVTTCFGFNYCIMCLFKNVCLLWLHDYKSPWVYVILTTWGTRSEMEPPWCVKLKVEGYGTFCWFL